MSCWNCCGGPRIRPLRIRGERENQAKNIKWTSRGSKRRRQGGGGGEEEEEEEERENRVECEKESRLIDSWSARNGSYIEKGRFAVKSPHSNDNEIGHSSNWLATLPTPATFNSRTPPNHEPILMIFFSVIGTCGCEWGCGSGLYSNNEMIPA